MACRDQKKTKEAEDEIKKEFKDAKITSIPLDLGSYDSIDKFVEEFQKLKLSIDILINNAGVMATPQWKTKDGNEYQFGINHLGHFRLTNLLLPFFSKDGGRIVALSSSAHKMGTQKINFDDIMTEKSYSPWTSYAQSKLSNILFSHYLNKKLKESNKNIIVNSLHPGGIMTDLQRDLGFVQYYGIMLLLLITGIGKTIPQGASTTVYCAISSDIKEGGNFYEDCNLSKAINYTDNESEQKKLWELSEKLTNTKYPF
jgi:NAD(P)-dependent dehydrogenase (short-subunit alcohol dehydrogenase family)